MPTKNNNKQNIEIAELKNDLSWIRDKVSCIEKAVYNDIPHKIDELQSKFMWGMVIAIISFIVVQILTKLF